MSIFIDKQELLTSSDIPKSYWNLFDGTADFSGKDWHFLNSYSNDPALKSPNGNQSMQRKGNWEGLSKNIYLYSGRIYTISEAVFVDKNTSNGHIHIYGNNLGNSKKPTGTPREPNYYHLIFLTSSFSTNSGGLKRFLPLTLTSLGLSIFPSFPP